MKNQNNETEVIETETIVQQSVLDLPTLDDDPVSNEGAFRISDEAFAFRRSREYVDDFESLVDMAGE